MTSVPWACPAAGWTTIPAGLSTTTMSGSSYTISTGQRLGLRRCRRRRWNLKGHDVAAAYDRAGPALLGPDPRVPVLDQPLDLRAGTVSKMCRQHLVQPEPRVLRGDRETDDLGIANVTHPGCYARPPARRGPRWLGAQSAANTISITMLSGMSRSETNCEVDRNSKTVPRGSPR